MVFRSPLPPRLSYMETPLARRPLKEFEAMALRPREEGFFCHVPSQLAVVCVVVVASSGLFFILCHARHCVVVALLITLVLVVGSLVWT